MEATTEFPGLSLGQIPALFLVVPHTEYHTNVLGTSVFNTPIDRDLPSVWQLALRALAGQEKLNAISGSIGQVKTTKAITVPARGKIVVSGLTRAAFGACMRMNVKLEESAVERLPGGLLVTPGLRHLHPGKSERVAVKIVNSALHDVTIPSKTCLCDLHQVSVIPRRQEYDRDVNGDSLIRPTQSTPVVDDKVVSSFEDCLSRHLDQKQI